MNEYPEEHTVGGTPRDEINVGDTPGDQTPPKGYEPQVDPGVSPEIYERDAVNISDIEDELETGDVNFNGEADDGDDDLEDDEED